MNTSNSLKVAASSDLAGCLPIFPPTPGATLATSLALPSFRPKRLLFNQLTQPGQIHVYRVECRAGERVRVQMLAPVLSEGESLAPAFAVVAQSLPYSADVRRLPFELPAGYSAVVAPPPSELTTPVRDLLTNAGYFLGPVVDTRTLVSGHCYIVVWSPQQQTGRYVLQAGHSWPLYWSYWAQVPRYWWQIRGWFGLSRRAAYLAGAGLLATVGLITALISQRKRS